MKRILLFITMVILTTALFGCKKTNSDANVLNVGLNAEFPPFEYIEKGKIVGFDVEIMDEIGRLINKKIEYKHMAFDGLLIAIQTGKIDAIISGMTETEERRKNVDFSSSYFVSKQAVIVKDDSTVSQFDELKGKKIGVVLGFTGDTAVTDMFSGTATILRYDSTGQVVLALNSGKVDAIVLDSEPAKEYAANNKGLKVLETPLAEESYSIAVPKGNTELLNEINKALETIKSNGTYDKIYAKYFNI